MYRYIAAFLSTAIIHCLKFSSAEWTASWLDFEHYNGFNRSVSGSGFGFSIGGDVYTWGSNDFGALGSNSEDPISYRPSLLGGLRNFSALHVACGKSFCAAITEYGVTFTWGRADRGQLGISRIAQTNLPKQGTVPYSSVPLLVPGIRDSRAVSVCAGEAFAIVLMEDFTVYGWGDNRKAQVQDHSHRPSKTVFEPQEILAARNKHFVQAFCGSDHVLFLTSHQQILTMGGNSAGQLGIGDQPQENINEAVIVSSLKVVDACASRMFSAAVTDDGKLYVWGSNSVGQLGLGDTVDRRSPVQLVIPSPAQNQAESIISKVACGQEHMLAINSHGEVFSWGRNDAGQLGLGHTIPFHTPQVINFNGIELCDTQDSAKISDSFVDFVCVGSSRFHTDPPLAIDMKLIDVAAGGQASFVITNDTSVIGFGLQENGQAGVEGPDTFQIIRQLSPRLVTNLFDKQMTELSVGMYHAAARSARVYHEVFEMLPRSGPIGGGTPLYFIGKNLNSFKGQLIARFERFLSNGSFLSIPVQLHEFSSLRLRTSSPKISNDQLGDFNVTVYVNGMMLPTSKQLIFKYFGLPLVHNSIPTRGPFQGNSETVIIGEGFDANAASDVRCRWGYNNVDPNTGLLMWVRGHLESETRIKCDPTPAVGYTTEFPIMVTLNGEDYSEYLNDQAVIYLFYREPEVISIRVPEDNLADNAKEFQTSFVYGIPENIEAIIDVIGIGFKSGVAFESVIRVANRTAQVLFVEPTLMRCRVPSLTGIIQGNETATRVQVAVSLNGQDFTTETLDLVYFKQPEVYSVFPRGGPQDRSTLVQVHGKGFKNFEFYPLCRFGLVNSTFYSISDTEGFCFVPALPSYEQQASGGSLQQAFFSLTLNSQHYINTSTVSYTYYPAPNVTSIVPAGGPTFGNTSVLLRGHGMTSHNESVRCWFGTESTSVRTLNLTSSWYKSIVYDQRIPVGSVPAVVLNDNLLRCLAPSMSNRTVFIQVTLNGIEYSVDDNSQFKFYDQPVVSSIKPSGGHWSGSTSLTISGDGFENYDENVLCRFGSDSIYDADRDITIPVPAIVTAATPVSATELLCLSPTKHLPQDSFRSVVDFSISLNGFDFARTSNRSYVFYEHPSLRQPSPAGAHTFGSEQVVIFGSGFQRFEEELIVKFGDVSVPATAVSDQRLLMQTPAHAIADVALEVTLNGQDFSSNSLIVFSFFEKPELISLFPRGGPFSRFGAVQYTTTVQIKGRGLSSHFGQTKVKFDHIIVDGTILDNSTIQAVAPNEMALEGSHPMRDVIVEISLNGQDFTNLSTLSFRFYDQPSLLDFLPKGGPVEGETLITYTGVGLERFNDGSLLIDFGGTVMKCEDHPGERLIIDDFDANSQEVEPLSTEYGEGYIEYWGSQGNDTSTLIVPTREEIIQQKFDAYTADTTLWSQWDTVTSSTACGAVSRKALLFQGAATNPLRGRYIISKPIDVSRGGTLKFFLKPGHQASPGVCEQPDDVDRMRLLYKPEDVHQDANNPDWFGLKLWTDIDSWQARSLSKTQFTLINTGFSRTASMVPCPKNELCINRRARLMLKQDIHAQGPFDVWVIDELNALARGGISTDTSLFCATPAAAGPSSIPMQIAFNGQLFLPILPGVAASLREFKYYQHPDVLSVTPSGGPVEGGTLVTISGVGFNRFFDSETPPKCSFGPGRSAANVVSDTVITCRAPSTVFPDPVNIEIALNGIDFSISKTKVVYLYYVHPYIRSVVPAVGLFDGGSRVILGGSGFEVLNIVPRCQWRRVDNGEVVGTVVGQKVNDTSIICPTTPTLPMTALVPKSDFFLEVSLNENDFSNRQNATFVASIPPQISAIIGLSNVNNESPAPITLTGKTLHGSAKSNCAFKSESFQDFGWVMTDFLYRTSKEILCQPPSFPGQGRQQSASSLVTISLNNVEAASPGTKLSYFTPEALSSKLAKGLSGGISSLIFLVFVLIVYLRHKRRTTKFVSVPKPWTKPSVKLAKDKMVKSCPRKQTGELFPLWRTTAEEFGQFGIGIGLYYQFLRYMALVFMIIFMLHVPSIAVNIRGPRYEGRTDVTPLVVASVGSWGEVTATTVGSGTTLTAQEAGLFLGVVETLVSLVLLISWIRLRSRQNKVVDQIDEESITARDYTVFVEDVPPKEVFPEEYKSHFGRFGKVYDVQLALDQGSLIRLFGKRADHMIKMEVAEAKLAKFRKSTQLKVVKKMKDKLKDFDKKVLQLRSKSDFSAVGAFITFDQDDHLKACLKEYKQTLIGKFLPVATRKLFKKRYKIRVSQAAEPSNLKWENMQVRGFQRVWRNAFTTFVTLTLLLISFSIILLSKGLKESLSQEGGSAQCVEAPDPDSEFAQQEILWFKYSSTYAKYQSMLACYCVIKLETERSYCQPYVENQARLQALTLGSVAAVAIMNVILKQVLIFLAKFEKHHTVTSEERATALKIFIAQFMNTALINMAVNIDLVFFFPSLQFLKDMGFLTGIYTDFSSSWFSTVSEQLAITIISNAFVFPIATLAKLPQFIVMRILMRNRVLTQRQLDNLYMGPEYVLSERYGIILSNLFAILLYNGGMPYLTPFGAIFFGLLYWCDKIALLRVFQTPAQYDEQLAVATTSLMPVALTAHMGFAIWMIGYISGDTFEFPGLYPLPWPTILKERMFKLNILPMLIIFSVIAAYLAAIMVFAPLVGAILGDILDKQGAKDEDEEEEGNPSFMEALENQELKGLETYDIKKNDRYRDSLTADVDESLLKEEE